MLDRPDLKAPAKPIKPAFERPPLVESRPPRCPPMLDITHADQLLPYLDAVAKRPYNQGLHACWDLKPGERVLLRVDNWHDPMVIEASKKILEKYGCKYEIRMVEKGPIPQWKGADEVEYYLHRTKELADWMDQWDVISKEGKYDKLLWGYGGPVLCDTDVKIQRMPFITPEILASPAHTMPYELLQAIDLYTWKRILKAKRVRIQDPEGTDLTYTNHDGYYDSRREFLNPELVQNTWTGNEQFGRTYLPGHVLGKPWIFLPGFEDGNGYVAGTTNHIAPCDWTQLVIENSRVTQILEGGEFGDKLRKLKAETDHLQYPGFPGKGLMYWWEASIGTNPHIHRPRKDFPSGFVNCLYERVRSGVIHIGFGTIISSMAERIAARQGLPVGHWHLHLYFPTVTLEMQGDNETIIENGRLCALDDPEIRKMAAKYGDADLWLDESWIPAVPGLNVQGDYWRDYGRDPMKWVKSELDICRNWHHLFMPMVGADPKFCHDNKRFWMTGGGVHDHWNVAGESAGTAHQHGHGCGCS
jgi:hypothetical protein